MIKNLRRRFTIVAMCSMFAVLATIMAVFNILNYVRLVENADNSLRMITENDGKFPSPPSSQSEPEKMPGEPATKLESEQGTEQGNRPELPEEKRNPETGQPDGMSPEAPFQTRYFTIRLDENGDVISSDLQNIAAVSEEEAEEYAKEVFESRKTKGFLHVYRYQSVSQDGGAMIVFLDCREKLESFQTNLLTSLAVSAAGIMAVFILVLIFSGIVFRPVAEGYEKQKQFITDASHEIKTPLTIIDANIEVIEMEHGEDGWTKSIRKQVRRLADFTQQMVTLTRLDEQGAWKQRSEFSLSDAVKESVEPFEVFVNTSGKKVETDVQENVTFLGDEKLVRQLIILLMDNAVKYSLPESTIYVSLVKKGKRIRLEVQNETEHVPQENLDLIFERFYRLDASRNSETGGTGIGLSVARAIVEAHHGKIRAHSDDGRTIRIRVDF